jgi:hypothetical protein
MEDKPCCGRPCTSKKEENVTKVRARIRSDRHLTVTMIGSELNLNHQTIHNILTEEMGMWTLGCCVPVTLPSLWMKFWPKRVSQWFQSYRIHLICVCVTSSFSQNSNSTKVIVLELWTTSKNLWQTSWGHFYVNSFSSATRSGNNVSGCVWLPKGRGWCWFWIQFLIKNVISPVALLFRHTLHKHELSVPRERSPENTYASGNSENGTKFYTQYHSMWLTIFLGGTVNWTGPDSFTSWSKGQHSNTVVCKLGKTMKICLQICCLLYFHIRCWP